MPGIGPHPKGLHQWWARLPLPAARAVLFASIVNDPSSDPEFAKKDERSQKTERERLFEVMRRMLEKDGLSNEDVILQVKKEIDRSCGSKLPIVLDPFCGGGSIPLEAARMGLEHKAKILIPWPY